MMSTRLFSCCHLSKNLAIFRQPAKRITLTSSTFFHIQPSLVKLTTAEPGGCNSCRPWAEDTCRHYQNVNSPRFISNESPKSWDEIKDLPRYDPDKGELVYVGTLAFMVKSVKAFSLSTSLIGLCLQPYLLIHTQGHALATIIAVGSMMGFFIFATPLMIHFITKKYVTDLYYNAKSDVFTATTYNLLVRRKKWQFTPDDVTVPEVPGIFTTILVKGRGLFLDPSLFISKQAYIKLMGYDKPLEWEIPDTQTKEKVKREL